MVAVTRRNPPPGFRRCCIVASDERDLEDPLLSACITDNDLETSCLRLSLLSRRGSPPGIPLGGSPLPLSVSLLCSLAPPSDPAAQRGFYSLDRRPKSPRTELELCSSLASAWHACRCFCEIRRDPKTRRQNITKQALLMTELA